MCVFGVGQGTEGFLPLHPQSVSLPRTRLRRRLDYGQLWQEPAITGLDWLFTPNPRLREHLYVAPLQASTPFYRRFTLPRNRSTGFGSCPRDCRQFRTWPLASCGLLAFALGPPFRVLLATMTHSRARYSKRTAHDLVSRVPHYNFSVSRSFHSLSWVLFSFRSRYSFAIGLIEYLGFAVDACGLRAPCPRRPTLGIPSPLLSSATRLSLSLVARSSALRIGS